MPRPELIISYYIKYVNILFFRVLQIVLLFQHIAFCWFRYIVVCNIYYI